MSFIKKIFEGRVDESVHQQFVRFGKGIYEKRAVVGFWKTSKIKVRGTFEYANDFVTLVAEFGGGKVSGIVLSKNDISNIMSSNLIKGNSETKRGGIFYQNNIEEQNLSEKQLKLLLENSYFALLDIEGGGFILKTKKKLPKPGKSTDAKVDDKFCVLEADEKHWSRIKEMFFWDLPDVKKASTLHSYEIKEIIIPSGEKDFEKIRVMSKRKGKLIRKIEIDGKIEKKEMEFTA